MTKKKPSKRDYWQQLIAGLKKEYGDRVKITPLDDPPAPKSSMTGAQLADYFSPQEKQKGGKRGGKHGN